MTDIDNYDGSTDAVVMMTMHSAKGLEFPCVFLPGFEDGIFPGVQAIYNPEEIEEERRLAYVAITRAKEELMIINADSRIIFGTTNRNKLSRFAKEIPRGTYRENPFQRMEKSGGGYAFLSFQKGCPQRFHTGSAEFWSYICGTGKETYGYIPSRGSCAP